MTDFFIYYITDGTSMKIGKSVYPEKRLADLQTGNSAELSIVNLIKCSSKEEMYKLEQQLHKKYSNNKVRKNSEWFTWHSDFDCFPEFLTETKKYRDGHDIFGEKLASVNPKCFFYPELDAQILNNSRIASNLKVAWRTMTYPTNGEPKLLPYSHKLDKVFISTKKHIQNLELNRFTKKSTSIPEFSQLDQLFS